MRKIRQKIKENNQNIKDSITSNSALEDRLKVIANLIVDRIIEDHLNGNLHLRTHNK